MGRRRRWSCRSRCCRGRGRRALEHGRDGRGLDRERRLGAELARARARCCRRAEVGEGHALDRLGLDGLGLEALEHDVVGRSEALTVLVGRGRSSTAALGVAEAGAVELAVAARGAVVTVVATGSAVVAVVGPGAARASRCRAGGARSSRSGSAVVATGSAVVGHGGERGHRGRSDGEPGHRGRTNGPGGRHGRTNGRDGASRSRGRGAALLAVSVRALRIAVVGPRGAVVAVVGPREHARRGPMSVPLDRVAAGSPPSGAGRDPSRRARRATSAACGRRRTPRAGGRGGQGCGSRASSGRRRRTRGRSCGRVVRPRASCSWACQLSGLYLVYMASRRASAAARLKPGCIVDRGRFTYGDLPHADRERNRPQDSQPIRATARCPEPTSRWYRTRSADPVGATIARLKRNDPVTRFAYALGVTTPPSISVESPRAPGVEPLLDAGSAYARSLYPTDVLLDVPQLEAPNTLVYVARDGDGTAIGVAAIVASDDVDGRRPSSRACTSTPARAAPESRAP